MVPFGLRCRASWRLLPFTYKRVNLRIIPGWTPLASLRFLHLIRLRRWSWHLLVSSEWNFGSAGQKIFASHLKDLSAIAQLLCFSCHRVCRRASRRADPRQKRQKIGLISYQENKCKKLKKVKSRQRELLVGTYRWLVDEPNDYWRGDPTTMKDSVRAERLCALNCAPIDFCTGDPTAAK